ncbi:hypothetical protein RB195_006775 [Necator americanus]|uniref:Transposase n=2 Tax=Necator americanus TaxID=51031 RepID=A0ABR1BX37_NECAM
MKTNATSLFAYSSPAADAYRPGDGRLGRAWASYMLPLVYIPTVDVTGVEEVRGGNDEHELRSPVVPELDHLGAGMYRSLASPTTVEVKATLRPNESTDFLRRTLNRAQCRWKGAQCGESEEKFFVAQQLIVRQLRSMRKLPNYELRPKYKLLGCSPEAANWLDTIFAGDEKWVLYVNHTHKLHAIYRFELLPDNTAVTAEVCCAQLQRLADKIHKEHPKLDHVRMLQDNVHPHITKKTSQQILELGWEVLPQPPYSPNLASSDYHLFRSLQHHLEEKRYDDRDHLENDLRAFFASKLPKFYAK